MIYIRPQMMRLILVPFGNLVGANGRSPLLKEGLYGLNEGE